MKHLLTTSFMLVASFALGQVQSYQFKFSPDLKFQDGFVTVTPETLFNEEQGYGYDLQSAWDGKSDAPFFFSVNVPDGNYKVTVTLGSKKSAGSTTVRGESRRLFIENLPTVKGELKTESFVINKRNVFIKGNQKVKIKASEKNKLNWDDKLTLEFNGEHPRVSSLVIERVEDVPTVFLCGNSTVVDYDEEPYASWGQMIPRFFNEQISIANYAECGLSANTFIGGLRLDETACDLPACLAMASSLLDLPIPEKTLAMGEVGLGGEVRSVPHLETRLREAQRVGFDTAIVPRHNLKMIDPRQFPGLRLIGVAYLREAVNAIKLKD